MQTYLVPVEVREIWRLWGAYDPQGKFQMSVDAHISDPYETADGWKQYVMLASSPQAGEIRLGTINPETRRFEPYTTKTLEFSTYERDSNRIIKQVNVRIEQVRRLPTLDEVLKLRHFIGISQKFVPER
jgi:hypothetical protein